MNRTKKLIVSAVTLSTLAVPTTALASTRTTPASSHTTTITGKQVTYSVVNNPKSQDRVVKVNVGGKTTVVTYNKKTKKMLVVGPKGNKKTFDMSKTSPPTNTISPNYYLSNNYVQDQWWGDEAEDTVFTSYQRWYARINGNTGGYASWSGYQSSYNESALNNFWNAVAATRNKEFQFYASTGAAATSAIVGVITAGTGVGGIVGAVLAVGFSLTAAYLAAEAWTDHNSDVHYYYEIPGT